jgi:ABC-type multidrug transport system fused ATPase/permease subunit
MTLDTLKDPVEAPMASFALKNGLITALVGIAISLVIYLTGNIAQTWAGWVGLPVIIYLYYFFQKKFRDEHQEGYITFGKAFKLGALMVVIGSVLNGIYSYFVFSDPEVMDQILEKSYNDMVDNGMNSSQIDQAMEMSASFMTPAAMMAFAAIGGIFFGLILVLITSAIVKKDHAFN